MAAARVLGDGRTGGAVPLCTKMVPYKGTVNKRNGLLIDNDQWHDALEALVRDRARRYDLAAGGLAWVEQYRDMARGYTRWGRTYRSLV